MSELAIKEQGTSATAIFMNPTAMQALVQFADLMSKAAFTIPKHLQNKPSDCLAIAMQATHWGMDPFVVAQKTHLVNGTLGYEAQLINAVVQNSGFVDGMPQYEYRGEGLNLECRVAFVPRGKTEAVWGQWLRSADVKVKNSPLWQVNPAQQLGYLQVKNWARAYCPGAILGVYSDDELLDAGTPLPPGTREMGAVDEVQPTGPRRKSGASQVAALPNEASPTIDMETGEIKEKVGAGEQPQAETAKQPAPQAPAAATPSGDFITPNQAAYLRNKMKQAGVEESSILARFDVQDLGHLRGDQFDTLKAELLAMV